MTLTFVAFHLNLTAFAPIGPPPPMCVLGKEVRSVGVFRTPKRHGNFLHHSSLHTTRGRGRSVVELENTRRPSSSHSSTAQESAPLHPTARFANSVTAPSRTFSDATLQPSAHSAAGFCSRFRDAASHIVDVKFWNSLRRPVLNINSLDRAKQCFSIHATNPFLHPISSVAT